MSGHVQDRDLRCTPLAVRQWRQLYRLTQAEAAERFGTTARTWRRWEHGASQVKARFTFGICSDLGMNPGAFDDLDCDAEIVNGVLVEHRSPLDGEWEALEEEAAFPPSEDLVTASWGNPESH